VRVLSLSWLIFMLPHSIVAVSIATAYYTRMSTHAHEGNLGGVRSDLSASMRSIGLIMVFSAVGLIVLAFPFSAVFDSDFDDVQKMGYVVIAYLVGLVPFSILFLIQRTFYSLGDTRTPFFLQVFQSALFVLGALVVLGFEREWIAVGIASVTSIAGSAQALVAAVVLRRRLGRIDAARILRRYAVFLLAALPTAVVGALLASAMGATTQDGFAVAGWFTALVSMAVIGGVMALVYAGVLVAFRNPELGEIVRPIVRRLRGRG
jgi:putative peptidoglycan lipid II flippase